MRIRNKAVVYIWLPSHGFVPNGVLLVEEEGGQPLNMKFQYDKEYLEHPEAISLDPVELPLSHMENIIDSPPEKRTFGVMFDCCPDNWGQKILSLTASEKRVEIRYFDFIVSGGFHRIGALGFGPDRIPGPRWDYYPLQEHIDIQSVDIDLLARAFNQLETHGFHNVDQNIRKYLNTGSSVGGARPKALIEYKNRPHIAKFKSPDDIWDEPTVEYASMTLAAKAGLDVPGVSLLKTQKANIFLIERFDRKNEDRKHILSGMTMVGAKPGIMFINERHSYQDLCLVIDRFGHKDFIQGDKEELYKRLLCSILLNNEDDHLRNFGFIWDKDGCRLSPFYDFTPSPSPARHLMLNLGKNKTEMSLSNALSQCEYFGLDRKKALNIAESIVNVFNRWESHFADCQVTTKDLSALRMVLDRNIRIDLEFDREAKKIIQTG
jgi:serine/threonine-protein kinase HipA